jgi:hypothetical protein
LAGLAVRVERGLRGRRPSRSGREVLAARRARATSGAGLPGAVRTRSRACHSGDAKDRRYPDQAHHGHLSHGSHVWLSLHSWGGRPPGRNMNIRATSPKTPRPYTDPEGVAFTGRRRMKRSRVSGPASDSDPRRSSGWSATAAIYAADRLLPGGAVTSGQSADSPNVGPRTSSPRSDPGPVPLCGPPDSSRYPDRRSRQRPPTEVDRRDMLVASVDVANSMLWGWTWEASRGLNRMRG